MNKKLLMVLLLSTFVLYLGCNLTRVSSAPSNSATASSGEGNSSVNNLVDNKIISFSIGDRSASINKNNITVLVPIGTDLTN
ncbi:MAG: hypothetical protein WCQ47_08345, partial [bacterium]